MFVQLQFDQEARRAMIFCRFLSWFLLFEYLFERSDLKGSCDRVTILVYLVFLVEKYWFPCAELHANRLL